MDRRTRICIWIIVGGLFNFLLFTLVWFVIGGDARNGYVTREMPAGEINYYLRMRIGDEGREVAQGWFIYSAIHGVSIWITCAAVLLAMLTLAKDHIVNALSEGFGRALIHVFAFVVVVTVIIMTATFVMDFRYELKHPRKVDAAGREWDPTTTGPASMQSAPRYEIRHGDAV